MDIKPFLAGMPLGPISGVASILMGAEMSQRRRAEEQAARELEEQRKIEMKEVEGYASKGNHAMLQQAYDSGMYTALPQDYRDRALFRAGTYSNQQIALDAERATNNGMLPYMGGPQQMTQAMQMTGQAPQQPAMPPQMATQLQAGLPAGTPGQVAASTELAPPINAPMSPGAVHTQEALGLRSGSQFGDFGRLNLPPSGAPLTMPPAARVENSPNPTQYGPGFDYQGKPTAQPAPTIAPTTAPYNADFPQHITAEPIAMAEHKQYSPDTTASTLQWPKLTRPGKPSLEGPFGTLPGKSDSQLTSGALTQTMLNQAARKNMSPAEFEREYAEEAIKRKGDLPEIDHQQLTDYRDRYFGRRVQQITTEIQSTSAGQSMDPSLIQQSAVRAASREMGNYIPTRGGDAIGFTNEERHLSTVNQATAAAARELETAIRIVESGGKYKPDFGTSFADIIDNSPSLKPEEKSHIKQQFTQQIATRIAAKSDPTDPFGRMKAMLTAASMTGGAVPHEWQQLVMGDPKSFGMSQGMVDKYLTGKFNIFEPGGYDRLANAVADDVIQGKLVDRAIQDPTHAEVYANAATQMKQQPVAGPGAPPAQSPLAGMGAATRSIDVQQREAESAAGVKGTKVEERRQVVESVAQPLSDLAKSMKRYMDIPLTNVGDSANAATLYSSQLKTMRSILAKGVLLQSGALNEQEQEAAMGALSGLIEAKSFPDVADEKIATLNRLMTKAFGKPVDLLADDPLNPQAAQSIKVDKQGNIISGPPEFMEQLTQPAAPSVSPPPPPPTPQPGMPQTAPAQMMPMSAPTPQQSPSLPPINEQVDRAKSAHPSEAAPKFGPGSTSAAAATVHPDIQATLTHQDKVALANAMHRFGRGDIEDRQLELEVAKVLGRVGKGKLEGQALNRAVTAYTEILRKGATAKKGSANGR
jgi:hypothetical protein